MGGKVASKEQCLRHARNPKPGDYWHEMLCPILVVLDVNRRHRLVTVCKERVYDTYRETWSWDLSKAEIMSFESLVTYLAYSGEPHKGLWARVMPRHMLDVVEEWKGGAGECTCSEEL
jgi:hypothetical protein